MIFQVSDILNNKNFRDIYTDLYSILGIGLGKFSPSVTEEDCRNYALAIPLDPLDAPYPLITKLYEVALVPDDAFPRKHGKYEPGTRFACALDIVLTYIHPHEVKKRFQKEVTDSVAGIEKVIDADPETRTATVEISPERAQCIEDTLKERGSRYGSFEDSARISQAIKRAMIDTPNWLRLDDDQREALEIAAHKMARILNGDPNYVDSWHDIIGYIRLVEIRLEGKKTPGLCPPDLHMERSGDR